MATKPPSNGSKLAPPTSDNSTAISKDAVIELVTDVAEEAAARGADRALDDFRDEINTGVTEIKAAKPKESVQLPGWANTLLGALIGALMATLLGLATYVWNSSETKATALIAKEKINVVETQQKQDTVRFKKWIKINNSQHKVITEQSQRTDRNIEKMLKKMNLEPEPAPAPAPSPPEAPEDLDLDLEQ